MILGRKVDRNACLHAIGDLLALPTKHRHEADLLANM